MPLVQADTAAWIDRSAIAVTTTKWTCTRCGAAATVPDFGQPDGWSAIYRAPRPDGGAREVVGCLCVVCDELVLAVLKSPHGPDATVPREAYRVLGEIVEAAIALADAADGAIAELDGAEVDGAVTQPLREAVAAIRRHTGPDRRA